MRTTQPSPGERGPIPPDALPGHVEEVDVHAILRDPESVLFEYVRDAGLDLPVIDPVDRAQGVETPKREGGVAPAEEHGRLVRDAHGCERVEKGGVGVGGMQLMRINTSARAAHVACVLPSRSKTVRHKAQRGNHIEVNRITLHSPT